MNKLIFFVFLGLVLNLDLVYSIGESCGGNVKDFRITGCKEEPCLLKKGSSGDIELDFIVSENTEKLTADISCKIMNRDVPWPGANKNACKDCNISCPVEKDSVQTYKYQYKILPAYPKISTVATVKLLNDNQNVEACYKVNVKIV